MNETKQSRTVVPVATASLGYRYIDTCIIFVLNCFLLAFMI